MSTGDRQPCPQCGALNYVADDICVSCGYDLPPGGPQPDPPPSGKAEPAPPAEDEQAEPSAPELAASGLWSAALPRSPWGCAEVGCGAVVLVLALLVDVIGSLLFGWEGSLFRFHAMFEWISIDAWLTGIGGAVGAAVGWGVSGRIAEVFGRWDRRVVRGSVSFIGLAIGAVGTSWFLESASPF